LYIAPFSNFSSFCFSNSLPRLFLSILVYIYLCLRSGTKFSLFILAFSNFLCIFLYVYFMSYSFLPIRFAAIFITKLLLLCLLLFRYRFPCYLSPRLSCFSLQRLTP
jgi:hypothetical protein